MNVRKIKATVIAIATALTTLTSISVMNVSATTMSFLQGDVNGDGSISASDMVNISEYLQATIIADQSMLTRMDADNNKAIDINDISTIRNFMFGLATPQNLTNVTMLTVPDNDERIYWKHNCSSTNVYSYEEYTLNNSLTRTVQSREIPGIENTIDDENNNVVMITAGQGESGSIASGFIIDDHIIATAAHCVTDNGKNGNPTSFSTNIKVRVYQDEGVTLAETCDAVSVHVPKSFMDYGNDYRRCNYDYALIYVEEDLSEYGICNIGYMTDEFMATSTRIVTSGFTTSDNETLQRYYSSGYIVDFEELDENSTVYENKTLRYRTLGCSRRGKSGGPSYYEKTFGSVTTKVVVGILTHGGIDEETGVNYGSRGVMFTPTIARFYFNNSEIE